MPSHRVFLQPCSPPQEEAVRAVVEIAAGAGEAAVLPEADSEEAEEGTGEDEAPSVRPNSPWRFHLLIFTFTDSNRLSIITGHVEFYGI